MLLIFFSVSASAAPFAYVTNQASNNVSVIDLATNKTVATVPVGKAPAGVAVNSKIKKAFITNAEGGDVSVIDIATNKVIDTIPTGEA